MDSKNTWNNIWSKGVEKVIIGFRLMKKLRQVYTPLRIFIYICIHKMNLAILKEELSKGKEWTNQNSEMLKNTITNYNACI